MRAGVRSLVVPAILTILVGALLVALGLWQLHRLAWKEDLLATIAARTKAAPVDLPDASTWAGLKPADYEYRRVTLSGTFEHDKEALVYRGTEEGPGYYVMTPLALANGKTIIVNRGFVPMARKDAASRAAGQIKGETKVVGLMRSPEPRNLFTPADTPAQGQFFTRDPAEIAAAEGIAGAAPFTVDADATPNPDGWPKGGTTVVSIPNNHLSYALTWFGLALGLVGVFCAFAWRRLTQDGANHGPHSDGLEWSHERQS